jgi:hypothetical protein
MSNLNEISYDPNADDAATWASMREFGLRWDSYHEAQVREQGLREMETLPREVLELAEFKLARAQRAYACMNPEAAWVADMEHSVRVDLTDDQKERWVK